MRPVMGRRLRQFLSFLVLLLILDILFLVYKYTVVYSNSNESFSSDLKQFIVQGRRPKSVRYDTAKLNKLIKSDKILSSSQAKMILDPEALKQAVSRTRQRKGSVDTVLFLKTHKTGSSTLQNIILRYALLHNLTVALPSYKASFFWPAKFNAQSFVRKQDGVDRYQVLAHHAVFHKNEMEAIMVPNATYITILRNPVSLFRSAYKFYRLEEYCFGVPVDQFMFSEDIKNLRTGVCKKTSMPVRNFLAHDFGLPAKDMNDENAIHSLISQIDRTMALVLITELFDESLVLLKKKLNWSFHDIVYLKQNAMQHDAESKPEKHPVNVTDDILEFNSADQLLYQHFSAKLMRQLQEEFTEKELESELLQLHVMHDKYFNKCVEDIIGAQEFIDLDNKDKVFRPYGTQTMGYKLKEESLQDVDCRLLALPELSLTYYLKSVAFYGKENITPQTPSHMRPLW